MSQERPKSKYIVETDDGHIHVVLFDSLNNPLVKQEIAKLNKNTEGRRVSSETSISMGEAGPSKPKSSLSAVISAVLYLSKKTGRDVQECFEAFKQASYSIDGAIEILNKT